MPIIPEAWVTECMGEGGTAQVRTTLAKAGTRNPGGRSHWNCKDPRSHHLLTISGASAKRPGNCRKHRDLGKFGENVISKQKWGPRRTHCRETALQRNGTALHN